MSRVSIPVVEGKIDEASPVQKKCALIDKLLKELDTKSKKKLQFYKDSDKFEEVSRDKIGELDDFALALENAINIIAKI